MKERHRVQNHVAFGDLAVDQAADVLRDDRLVREHDPFGNDSVPLVYRICKIERARRTVSGGSGTALANPRKDCIS